MNKILDLNNLELPVLELRFPGENSLTLHVVAPSEALVNELKSWTKTDLNQISEGDEASIRMSYDLTARLLSCNQEGVELTADSLLEKIKETDACKKYKAAPLWVLMQIVKTYMSFISGIENEKN